MDSESLAKLAKTPVTKLSFWNVGLRRKIQQAGFTNIMDVLALTDREIDSLFDFDEADAIFALQKRFETDPQQITAELLRTSKIDRKTVDAILKRAVSDNTHNRIARTVQSMKTHPDAMCTDLPNPLLSHPCISNLAKIENQTIEQLDLLCDRYDNPLVYQAFSALSTELEDVDSAFAKLFETCRNRTRQALRIIEIYFPNAFLIFVANRARNVYDGENLWGNFFDQIAIDDGNVESDFKKLFVTILEKRNMPLYAKDEAAYCYFYTALLHGGLSFDSWQNLWASSFLPLAKEIANGHYANNDFIDGHQILREIRKKDSRFSPKTSVLKILEKAPASITTPLFEASLEIALQVEFSRTFTGPGAGAKMISSNELPDAALRALAFEEEEQNSRKHGRAKRQEKSNDKLSLTFLPSARLQLDIHEGVVYVCWEKQLFPTRFIDYGIDYYVDGKRVREGKFEASVGKCKLNSTKIGVRPQSQYEIELKLLAIDADTGVRTELSTLSQRFTKSKPGCFEFIHQAGELYRLRDRNERITKTRRIAYIVKNGYDIRPGPGMKAVAEFETINTWQGSRILLFDVEPGASGAIINCLSGFEIAVWQEKYLAKVTKSNVIGETAEGLDLYGYLPSDLRANDGLPAITIEALDGRTAINDLNFTCLADGERVSIPREMQWEGDEEGAAATVLLSPSKSSSFSWHIRCCEIEARQKSAKGAVVFRYRFSVVPIQEFRLLSADFSQNIAIAEYEFQSLLTIDIINAHGSEEHVGAWERYQAKALLKDEFLQISITSHLEEEKTSAVNLALAAIDINMPEALLKVSRQRPLCLADAFETDPNSAIIKLRALGRRNNRAACVLSGFHFFFLEEMKSSREHSFNLFNDCSWLLPDNNEPLKEIPLLLRIYYGDDLSSGRRMKALTDVKLLRSRKGYGFSSWALDVRSDGSQHVVLDEPLLCSVHIDYKKPINKRIICSDRVNAGCKVLEIPRAAAKVLGVKKRLTMTIAPLSLFGDPQYEYSTDFTVER